MLDKTEFDKLVAFFRENRYDVVVTSVPSQTDVDTIDLVDFDFEFAVVMGKGLRAGFCTSNNNFSYPQLNGRIAIDNDFVFDKWNKCPVVLELPVKNLQGLLELCQFLGSYEGEKYSRSLSYLNDIEWTKRLSAIV